jgi:predicted porin
MQALAKALDVLGAQTPKGGALYRATLAADLVSNGAYFAAVAPWPNPVLAGLVLGVAAGIGAVALPHPLNLSTAPTSRTRATSLMTALLYTAGGLAAGLVYQRLRD